ncbi:hypothetical protein [Saccharopolyspora elongata]|uniref:hypothetical protein n=1 Tax=Saccharopolyspora elongata TaxID=2530387 RepID=UPI001A9E0DE3|nr:hypothetical protein [Saccharopolyspora elongata]
MTGRPGRREAAIDPDEGPLQKFAHELRILRRQAGGPSFQELARQTRQLGEPFSTSTLRNAVSGSVLPTAEVTAAFVRACMRYAAANRHQLPDPEVLGQEVDELVAYWCRRRNELAQPYDREPEATEEAPRPEPRPEQSSQPGASRLEAAPDEVAGAEAGDLEPIRSRRARSALVAAAVMAVLLVVAGVVGFLLRPGEEISAATPIVASPATQVQADLIAQQCRGEFQRGPVKLDPCITAVPDGVRISVRVTAVEAAPEVAVHLWLRDATAKQRVPGTLHHCQTAFTAPGQTVTCGPVLIRPEPGRSYVAATVAEEGTSPVPAMFKDPSATGLNSAGVTWP